MEQEELMPPKQQLLHPKWPRHACPWHPASHTKWSSGPMEPWISIPRAVTGLIPLNTCSDLDGELSWKE